jgi:hypothetical protein
MALLSSLFVSSAQTGVTVRPSAVPTPPTVAPPPTPDPNERDVDSGPNGRGNLSFEEYLVRREQMINKLHGLPFSVPGNPRLKAIQLLKQQEAALRGSAAPSGSASAPAGSSSSPSAPTSGPTWTSVGPAPIPDGQTNLIDATRNPVSGRVLTIAVHPTNPDIVYVGTAQGGLYRSLNGGLSWTPLMDDALSLAVGAVTIDPLDPTTLFVGTGEGNSCGDCFFGVGFYIIKNAETTPTLLGPFNTATNTANGLLANSRSITKILVHPTDDNTIFVATSSGIGGINAGGGVGPNPSPRGLFRCENAMSGAPSCTKLNLNGPNGGLDTPVRDLVFEPGNPNVLLATVFDRIAAGTDGIWRTTNALAATPSFTRTLTTPDGTNVMLAIHKAGSTVTVYAATEDDANNTKSGVVRKSTDGGITWPTVLTSSRGFCGTASGGQCWYDMPIAVDPNDVNNVFIGGSGDYDSSQTACKVTTDGVNFVKKAAGLHPDVHAIAIAPSNTSIIYHGNDGGIFKSINDGNTWTSMNTSGFNATQFVSLAQHPTDRNFMIGGTQDNGTPFMRANGTWKLGQFGDGGYALIDRNATDTGNSVTAYHTFYNAKPTQIGFQRADGASKIDPAGWGAFYGCGANIVTPNGISCGDDTLFYAPMALGPGNPNTVYFGTDKIYRSADKGATMPAASQVFETNPPNPPATAVNTTVSAIGISPQDDNVRVVGITSGRVFATTTGLNVLTDVTPPVTPRRFIGRAAVDPNNAQTAYVTLVGYGVPNGQHIWKTTNLSTAVGAAAVTWTAAGNGIPDVPVDGFVIDPQNSNILYAGTDIGVYTSTDGGANWTPYGTGLPRVAVFDMAILNGARILRIATHGRGIWDIPIPGATIAAPPSFAGADQVTDLHDGARLLVSWLPAVSLNPTANIVYDIYRVPHVVHGDSTQDPTFTPNVSNKIATGVSGISYVDSGLTLAQPYYYIVQARDTSGGGLDTNGNGNRVVKFSAPTIPQLGTPTFALETFETAAADSRFNPALNEATTNPNQALQLFQRITVADLGTPGLGKMYSPDFSPGHEANGCNPDPGPFTGCGGQSDFSTQIGPFNGAGNPLLTPTSIMEFDNAIAAESGFDGGVLEIKVGSAFVNADATPFPDNTSVWDLGDYLIEGYYNARLDGALPAGNGFGSELQGRRAYTGIKGPHHVRADLRNFAPGGLHNPTGQPVYIRFRMTSDVASAAGTDAGWFVDNLVINNLACRVNVAAASAGATAEGSSTYSARDYPAASTINGDRAGLNWENGGGWNDGTRDTWPDSLTVNFNGSQTISEIGVYTVQNDFHNPVEPTPLTPADYYGIQDFDVQYWNGANWVTIPGGSVIGNDKAMRVFLFAPVTTTKIRVLVNNGRNHFSRITEVEAFGCSAP